MSIRAESRFQRFIVNAKSFKAIKSVTTAITTAFTSRKPLVRGAYAAAPVPTALRSSHRISAAGEEIDTVELQIKVDGMVCSGCSDRVLEALQKCDGVKNVAVDLESGLATIVLSAASQVEAFNALPKLMDIVNELGFEAQPHFA